MPTSSRPSHSSRYVPQPASTQCRASDAYVLDCLLVLRSVRLTNICVVPSPSTRNRVFPPTLHQNLLADTLEIDLNTDGNDKKKSKLKLMDKTKQLLGRKKSDAGAKADRALTALPAPFINPNKQRKLGSRRTIVETSNDFRKSSYELQEFLVSQQPADEAADLTSPEGYTRYLELIKVRSRAFVYHERGCE